MSNFLYKGSAAALFIALAILCVAKANARYYDNSKLSALVNRKPVSYTCLKEGESCGLFAAQGCCGSLECLTASNTACLRANAKRGECFCQTDFDASSSNQVPIDVDDYYERIIKRKPKLAANNRH